MARWQVGKPLLPSKCRAQSRVQSKGYGMAKVMTWHGKGYGMHVASNANKRRGMHVASNANKRHGMHVASTHLNENSARQGGSEVRDAARGS